MSKRNMSRVTLIIAAFIAAIQLGVSRPAVADGGIIMAAGAFDSCRNVSFQVKNSRSDQIQITKVNYFNQNEDRWQSETIGSNICGSGVLCKFGYDDLRDSEGDRITKIYFEFKARRNSNASWSGPIRSQEFHPDDPQCRVGRQYGQADWIISGGSSTTLDTDLFGHSCKNVRFTASNGIKEKELQITKVKYFNASESKWKTETVGSNLCRPDQACKVGPDDLGDTSGNNITKVIFEFKMRNRHETNWSPPFESPEFQPDDPMCRDGREYGATSWVITAKESLANKPVSLPIIDPNYKLFDEGDKCLRVNFAYSNGRKEGNIKIEQVKYFNRSSGNWKTVAPVEKEECRPGEKCFSFGFRLKESEFWGDSTHSTDLNDARGDEITKIIYVYKFMAPWAKNWSSKTDSPTFVPTNPVCSNGRTYGEGQNWTIK